MTVMPGIEVIALEASELDIPCDFGDSLCCQGQPAEWIMRLKPCCEQVEANNIRLACDICMNSRMLAQDSAVECVHCGIVTAPARKAYGKIDSIDKPL